MRVLKRIARSLLLFSLLFVTCAYFTSRPGNPGLYPVRTDSIAVDVYVVSHGYHAGIVLRREELMKAAANNGAGALIAVATRFSVYEWLEFGWGDEGFYREVPEISALTVSLAFKALFLPGNRSVIHVVGLRAHPRSVFVRSTMVRLRLAEAGFVELIRALDVSFAREADGTVSPALGRGLYGPSYFYRATGTFSILNVCNHWVASLLDRAGVPTTPLVDTLPQGLLFDLRWRAGAIPIP